MASTFTALELPSGEAFLLQTETNRRPFTVLVDSGHKKGSGRAHPLSDAIARTTNGFGRIDVAICTHCDADHANGYRDFADYWTQAGGTIGEFWLPGRWAEHMPDLLFNPARHFERTIVGAEKLSVLLEEIDPELSEADAVRVVFREFTRDSDDLPEFEREALEEVLADRPESIQREAPSPEDRLGEALGVDRESIDSFEPEPYPSRDAIPPYLPWMRRPWLSDRARGRAYRLALEAIETAKIIKEIAECAVRNRIPIRWFDFNQWVERGECATGGLPDIIVPLNACELKRPPRPEPFQSFAMFTTISLKLTPQNVESLVFWRPESLSEPGVLFTGDSRLAHGETRPTVDFSTPANFNPARPILVSAPHHGSQKNDHAYSVLEKWLGGAHLIGPVIKNGGQYNQRVRRFAQFENRACATCKVCKSRSGLPYQVAVQSCGADWPLLPGAALCAARL
ncbi:hypothetical protein [Marinicauda sp. Alg238-R41]|uniref:hypothetical protein n=1 Tax=Marinicauda sp. Alg238-R41 TaxID=2993447 RepID=UPI0022E629D6|nr:hypothetical protein [Marinicauda sp. Alg238-R41]